MLLDDPPGPWLMPGGPPWLPAVVVRERSGGDAPPLAAAQPSTPAACCAPPGLVPAVVAAVAASACGPPGKVPAVGARAQLAQLWSTGSEVAVRKSEGRDHSTAVKGRSSRRSRVGRSPRT